MFEYKQVIAVRRDLGMSPGKLAVQVAHASVTASEDARKGWNDWLKGWLDEKQKKVVVEVRSEEELEELRDKALELEIPCGFVQDAGLTELEPGTSTALGVGPAPSKEVDKVTGKLSLYGG